MSDSADRRTEFSELMAAQREGQLSAVQSRRLRELLENDPQARRLYTRYVLLEASLELEIGGHVPHAAQKLALDDAHLLTKLSRGIHWRSHPARFLLLVTTLTILVWVGFFSGVFVGPRDAEEHIAPVSSPRYVARVARVLDCQWEEDGEVLRVGSRLPVGQPVRIEKGRAEVVYDSGAKVVIAGPAFLTIDDDNAAKLAEGRATVHVAPSAVGFTIETTAASIVDLGTEFGVAVDESKTVDVQVFTGSVEARRKDTAGEVVETVSLVAGQAIRVQVDGKTEQHSAQRKAFPSMPKYMPVPLVGFYPLDGNANDASGNERHGRQVGAVGYDDGYEGSALELPGDGQTYLELPIDAGPEAMARVTFGAWVRPAEIGNQNRAILSTDNGGFDRALVIDYRDGAANAGFRQFTAFAGADHGVLRTGGSPPELNRWTFIAAVYDQRGRRVTLYVEDPATGQLRAAKTHLTRMGPSLDVLLVGRHVHNHSDMAPFAGRIDNVFVFQGALSMERLRTIQLHGAAGVRAVATGEEVAASQNTSD